METVADFISLGSKITADGDCSHEITEAENALGAHPGLGKPGLRGSRFRWLWVGQRQHSDGSSPVGAGYG